MIRSHQRGMGVTEVYPYIVEFSMSRCLLFISYISFFMLSILDVEQIFLSDCTGLRQDHTDSHSVIGLSRHWLNR